MASMRQTLLLATMVVCAASACEAIVGADFDPKQLAVPAIEGGGGQGVGGIGGTGGAGGLPLLSNGEPCSEPAVCGSGYCAHGVCCETACDLGECQNCAAAGEEGNCTPLPFGTTCPVTPNGVCDGAAYCSTGGKLRWSATFGSAGREQAVSCGFNSSGELWVAGIFDDSVSFDGMQTHVAVIVAQRIFLARFGPAGEPLWSNALGDDDPQSNSFEVDDLAVGPDGGVAIVGQLDGSLNTGGAAINSGAENDTDFLLVLGPAGQYLWHQIYEGDDLSNLGETDYLRVAYGVDGRVAVGGSFGGAADLHDGNGPVTATGGAASFVVVYEPDGSVAWSKVFDGSGGPTVLGRGVALLSNGDVAVAGAFSGADIEIDNIVIPRPVGFVSPTVYVATFDSTGTLLDGKAFGLASSRQEPYDLVSTSDGHFITTGIFAGSTFDIGGIPLTNQNVPQEGVLADAFIAKLSSLNVGVWADSVGPTPLIGNLYTYVGTDAAANVGVSGLAFDGSIIGSRTLSVTTDTSFVAKINRAGQHLWSRTVSVPTPVTARGLRLLHVAGGPAGEVAVCGFAEDTVTFEEGAVHSTAGGRDILVAVFGP
jgi:hypothetical protein